MWQALAKTYAPRSRASIMTVKYQFHTLKKGSLSMSDCIKKKKSIVDNLATVAEPISDSDMASSLLSGLGSDYEAFIVSMTTRVKPLSIDDLIGLLLFQKVRIEDTTLSESVLLQILHQSLLINCQIHRIGVATITLVGTLIGVEVVVSTTPTTTINRVARIDHAFTARFVTSLDILPSLATPSMVMQIQAMSAFQQPT